MFQSDYILPNDVSYGLKMAYFIINPSLFNVGWAAVQVAHMSLLPSISLCKKKQDRMTRLRTGFTFGSQLISLILSLLFFAIIDDKILQFSIGKSNYCCDNIVITIWCS
jgi:Na+/melibiose symporter-like transporter